MAIVGCMVCVVVLLVPAASIALVIWWAVKKPGPVKMNWSQRTLALALPTMKLSHSLATPNGKTLLCLDEARQWVALLRKPNACAVFRFSQVIKAELVEDGYSVSQSSRGSQLAGAAVGGMFFGRSGAIVGAVTGAKATRKKVTSVQVRITVDDLKQPLYVVEFMRIAVRRDHPYCQRALQSASQWVAALDVAMRRAAKQAAGG